MKIHLLILVQGLACGLLSSCLTPYPPNPYAPLPGNSPYPGDGSTLTDEDQEDIRNARDEARDQEENTNTPGGQGGENPDTLPPKRDYRVAVPMPGKEGFVFNPFTNRPVDVRGIPPGTLVRAPNDPNTDHKFRVP